MNLLLLWLSGVALAVVSMTAVWIVYRILQNPGIADVGWAVSLGVLALWFDFMADTEPGFRLSLITILAVLWALRLAGFLVWTRILPGHQDARYQQLARQWPDKIAFRFLLNYWVQALLLAVLALVFVLYPSVHPGPLVITDWIGLALWSIGLSGEWSADYALYRFRSDPANRNQVCQAGLWYYSRHPNYFFEILIWLGFAVMCLTGRAGYVGLLSPLLLYVIMRYITGPMTERASLQKRGEAYSHYQRTTAMIAPWFKKSN